MKIYCEGGRGYQTQISRIEEGFVQLGHEVTPYIQDADLVYVNNCWYDRVLQDKTRGLIKGKLILNVLDIPTHIFPDFDLAKLKVQLQQADGVTVISEFVQRQVKEFIGIEKAPVIYQPIMDVKKYSEKPYYSPTETYKYIMIGRKYDANKRVELAINALINCGVGSYEVAMIGHEIVGWGENLGVLRTEVLEALYNYADLSFSLGKIEGLNLPVVEAMACGCIPVVCNDLTTLQELLPADKFPEYQKCYPNIHSLSQFINSYKEFGSENRIELKDRLYKHYKDELEEKFSKIGVAKRIIQAYEKL